MSAKGPLAVAGATLGVVVCSISACGVSHIPTTPVASSVASSPVAPSSRPYEVLSLSALGTFQGRCPRGARIWTLRFVVPRGAATDAVKYRLGSARGRTVEVNPGDALTFRLVPYAARTHESPDRMVPPLGQGRGLTRSTSVPTTMPLNVQIYQGTEPQTLRADIRLALTAIGGESGQCVLVGSTVDANTYPNG